MIQMSGFMNDVKLFISKYLTKGKIATSEFRLKPFDCLFCSVWWSSLLYIIIAGQFTFVNVGLVCLLTIFSDNIQMLVILIKDLIIKLIDTIYDRLRIK